MTTDTAHATGARPPTPDDYERLREYLDRCDYARERSTNWPCVVPRRFARISDIETACAAWWTRLTAPRREAHADPAADKELEALGVCCGWVWHKEFDRRGSWDRRLATDGYQVGPWARENLTTRQMRARLAFDGATGVKCNACGGRGVIYVANPQSVFSPSLLAAQTYPCQCNGTGRVYPEAVPQADPASGVEPCGCAHRGPYRHEIERYAHNAVAYTELRYDRGCTFCRGTGNVRDGRREGEHDYAASSTAIMRVPHTVAAELEHRREQPDAFGHPWLCRLHLHLARAPLAELLHGEADGR